MLCSKELEFNIKNFQLQNKMFRIESVIENFVDFDVF